MITPLEYKQNEIVTLKLVTGEEIIGYFSEASGGTIHLRKPMSLVVTDSGVAFAPFIMTSDYVKENTHLRFNKDTIVLDLKTGKEFANAFTSQMSGLDLSSTTNTGLIM